MRNPFKAALRGPNAASVCLVSAMLVMVMGCSDERIGLTEFLSMQPDPGVSGQQAATKPPPLTLSVDKRLTPYKVGPDDVLSVTVNGESSETKSTVRVQRNGTIEMPFIEPVKVEDMELVEVESALKKKYTEKVYQWAIVHVDVTETPGLDVLVTGAVATPGMVHLRRNEANLLYSIVRAGGVSGTASGAVTLCRIREPQKKQTLNMTTADGVRAALALPPLENGDMVAVEAAMPNTIFVSGLVNSSAPQTYAPGVRITVLQAITAAGGLRTDVLPTEATLIRRLPNGKDIRVKLDLDRLACGKDPNIALAAGDILWVPFTLSTRIEDWCNKNLHITGNAGGNVLYNGTYTQEYNSSNKSNTAYLVP
jgi:protein involved in polysaccharide export with SLBB domain